MELFDFPQADKVSSDGLITFLDVETPNRHNDRICSIGIVQTGMRGDVVNSLSRLVNPEEPFDDICMSIHGIAPIDVKGAPSFAELWDSSLSAMLAQSSIVAHNTSFDLSVIWKCLSGYDLQAPELRYACTMCMMKSMHPELASHKLPSICDFFNIPMSKHHEAMSDAEACKDIFWAMVAESHQLPSFERYEYCSRPSYKAAGSGILYSEETKELRLMKGLAEKVIEDGDVSIDEACAILELCDALPDIANDRFIKPILSTIESAIVDGQIDEEKSAEIIQMLGRFVNPTSSSDGAADISFEAKNFVLSGNFEHGSKSSVAEAIQARGGLIIKSVTKKCDYVVVGGMGNENWSMGNYGSKVKAALDWQAKGSAVQIISESDLYDAL